jgi:hypothetical protein
MRYMNRERMLHRRLQSCCKAACTLLR